MNKPRSISEIYNDIKFRRFRVRHIVTLKDYFCFVRQRDIRAVSSSGQVFDINSDLPKYVLLSNYDELNMLDLLNTAQMERLISHHISKKW